MGINVGTYKITMAPFTPSRLLKVKLNCQCNYIRAVLEVHLFNVFSSATQSHSAEVEQ